MLPLNLNIGLFSGVNFNTNTFPSNILESDFFNLFDFCISNVFADFMA